MEGNRALAKIILEKTNIQLDHENMQEFKYYKDNKERYPDEFNYAFNIFGENLRELEKKIISDILNEVFGLVEEQEPSILTKQLDKLDALYPLAKEEQDDPYKDVKRFLQKKVPTAVEPDDEKAGYIEEPEAKLRGD